ncbi:MAG: hypothetical protein LRY50_01925, partial [Geovibrio sp.]|nr:hypothetical protein [Geovibrio sp.]
YRYEQACYDVCHLFGAPVCLDNPKFAVSGGICAFSVTARSVSDAAVPFISSAGVITASG